MTAKKEIKVSDAILKQTADCRLDFQCLSGKHKIHCKVSRMVGGSTFFVKCRSLETCNYQKRFGEAFVCTCPTRIEIYKRYKI